jgi:hypothetical protein
MAKDPAFVHYILRNVFRGTSEEKGEADAKTQANARRRYSVLSHFSRLPGESPEGIDGATLTAWIDEVRRLGAETDRAEITDSYVGRLLAHALPPDAGLPSGPRKCAPTRRRAMSSLNRKLVSRMPSG